MMRGASTAVVIAGLIVLTAVAIAGYAYDRSKDFLHGPRIIISEPKDGATTDTPLITIIGTAHGVAHITLNDKPIFVDESGGMRESILLLPGYNVITLSGRDQFDRTTKETIRIIYRQTAETATTTQTTIQETL